MMLCMDACTNPSPHHARSYSLSVSNGRGRKALGALMLTGCFVYDPLRGFDCRVFENIFQDAFEHDGMRGMMLAEEV